MNGYNLRPGLKDSWNAFMCAGAKYTSNDIPFCPTIIKKIPSRIITWDEAKSLHKKTITKDPNYNVDAYICFYIDDYKFDGPRSSIWTFPDSAFTVLKHFSGIITPDFSTYQDFPYPLKIYNTFRMRAFGLWVGNKGLEVINNVRWGTPETYCYTFDGIPKNSVVSIGTVGGSPKKLRDRNRFNEGLKMMVDTLSPQTIIVYGSSNYQCFDELHEKGIKILTFKSSTATYYEGRIKNE